MLKKVRILTQRRESSHLLAKNGDEKAEDKPAEEKTEEKAENGEEKKEEEKSEEKGNLFWPKQRSN